MQNIPLVMLHGLLDSMHPLDFTSYMPDVEVHIPHLPGYGGNPLPAHTSLHGQAEYICNYLEEKHISRCHLLGHSVGGAVGALVAARVPEKINSFINVEGNFTLDDAFMCRRIAALDETQWAQEFSRLPSDIPAWLAQDGIAATPEREAWARQMFAQQSAQTVQAIARAVIRDTAEPDYLHTLRHVAGILPCHLLAGERSTAGWHVPGWMRAHAASDTILSDCGHLMMLENPALFCNTLTALLYPSDRL